MTRAYLWYVIGTGQGYLLNDKRSPLECHRVDDKRLIPASHCYAMVVARWVEVLANYARQSNLTVIMSKTILEQLTTRRVALSSR